ncbi:MAG TPA: response regulator [Terriglobia bacterium]|nr:response regulator [Terriglobia bacterium]
MALRVLVADDSPTIQKKASGILTGEGLEVVTVSNGVAAIKKLPAIKPSLILADSSMPGKDGYEVCDFVKTSPDLLHVPVLLIISDLEPYDAARAAQVRVDGTVTKPFDPEQLISSVNRFLSRLEPPAQRPVPSSTMPTVPVSKEEREAEASPAQPDRSKGPETVLQDLAEGIAFTEPELDEGSRVPTELPGLSGAAAETTGGQGTEGQEFDLGAPSAEMSPVHRDPTAPPPMPEPPPGTLPTSSADEIEAPPETPAESVISGADRTLSFRVPAEIAEPVPASQGLIEPQPGPKAPAPREPGRTMTFRVPAEIAGYAAMAEPQSLEQPRFETQEVPEINRTSKFTAPTEIAATTREAGIMPEVVPMGVPPPVSRDESGHVHATTLESFSLDQAVAGEVKFLSSEVIARPSSARKEKETVVEAAAPPPEPAANAPESEPPAPESVQIVGPTEASALEASIEVPEPKPAVAEPAADAPETGLVEQALAPESLISELPPAIAAAEASSVGPESAEPVSTEVPSDPSPPIAASHDEPSVADGVEEPQPDISESPASSLGSQEILLATTPESIAMAGTESQEVVAQPLEKRVVEQQAGDYQSGPPSLADENVKVFAPETISEVREGPEATPAENQIEAAVPDPTPETFSPQKIEPAEAPQEFQPEAAEPAPAELVATEEPAAPLEMRQEVAEPAVEPLPQGTQPLPAEVTTTACAEAAARMGPEDVSAPALRHASIYSIVRKVVWKMAPGAIPPDVVEDIAVKLADEVIEELKQEPNSNLKR